MKAAVVQIRGDKGLEGNLAACAHWLQRASEAGAMLVVLPENFAYYGCRDLPRAAADESTPAGPVRQFLASQARSNGVWLLGGTIPVADSLDEKPHAASLLLSPQGEEVARYNKIHLFDVDVAETGKSYRESDDYRHGSDVVVAPTPLGNLGLSVCYDLRFPELYRALTARGAEILAVPSAFTAATGRAHWELLLRARAVENLCYVIAANLADRDHPRKPTWGGSAIIDPWGRVLAALEDEEGFAVADMDLGEQAVLRRNMPVLEHRRIL